MTDLFTEPFHHGWIILDQLGNRCSPIVYISKRAAVAAIRDGEPEPPIPAPPAAAKGSPQDLLQIAR